MNLSPYVHLAWKEYRAVRGFWLSIVVLVVLLEWLGSRRVQPADQRDAAVQLWPGGAGFFCGRCHGSSLCHGARGRNI